MAYLDHAATTPMFAEVRAAVTAAMGELGNPSSLHTSGRRARRRIEEAREQTAFALGARPSEVIFTAGGTEADNLAVKGMFWSRRAADPRRRRVIASAIEHHAVLDSVEWLATHEGADVVLLPVDRLGRVHPDALRAALADAPDETALVTVMWANNEVGTIQPVAELAAIAHEHGVPFHTDAVQAASALPVDFAESGADALSISAHKFGGPVGAGALLLRRDVACEPLLHGGGQERQVRSGTLNVPSAVGLALAASMASERRAAHATHVGGLRDRLETEARLIDDTVVCNGDPHDRLPGIAHLSFPGCEGDSLLMLLDANHVECSTGSACSAGVAQPSHVLLAMGADAPTARGSLRISFGHTSTDDDVDAALHALPGAIERARRAGLASAYR